MTPAIDGSLSVAANSAARVTFDSRPQVLRQTTQAQGLNFWVERTTIGDAVTLRDSANATFTYRYYPHGPVAALWDSSGRMITKREYDSIGRVIKIVVGATVTIQYEYDDGFDWSEKVIRTTDGALIARLPRRDYDDPDRDLSSHVVLRSALGDPIAEIRDDRLTYTASIVNPYAHLDARGQVLDRFFSFDSSAPFTDDEILVLPSGGLLLRPSLPHAEHTIGVRTVRPLEITIPFGQQATPNMASEATAGAPPLRATTLQYTLIQSCEYIPGGTVTVNGMDSYTPGRWDCTSYWVYSPDPSPPAGGGGGGSGGGYASGSLPATPQQLQKVNQGKSTAQDRLTNATTCSQLFSSRGADGRAILNGSTYRDGSQTQTCSDRPGAAAWTQPGSSVVYLCGAFSNLTANGAATVVIHEGLHTAGMTENPPDPAARTSAEINQLVQENCNLTW